MIQTNQELYNNLIGILTDEEAIIGPKVKYYLDHYIKELSIVNFKVYVLPTSRTVDRLILYTKDDRSEFRQLKFTPDGDLLSAMHCVYEGLGNSYKFVYGLPAKCIDKINKA